MNFESNGDMNINGDVIGRDKVIYNIFTVGQFLNQLNAQGILGIDNETMPEFETIRQAIDKNLRNQNGANFSQSISFAGEVLGEVIKPLPSDTLAPIPIRDILSELPSVVISKLIKLDYWDSFGKIQYGSFRTPEPKPDKPRLSSTPEYATVLWLESLDSLSKKKNFDLQGIGLAKTKISGSCVICKKINLKSNNVVNIWASEFNRESFRFFMTGLVADMIRIASDVSNDRLFWNELASALSINKV